MRHGSAVVTDEEGTVVTPARSGAVASWPIRSKLVALVALPLLVIVAICAVVVTQAAKSLQDARKVHSLTDLALLSAQASTALQREQSQTVTAVATGAGAEVARQLRPSTEAAIARLNRALADAPGDGWPDRVNAVAPPVQDIPRRLPGLRGGADAGRGAGSVIGSYQPIQDAVLALGGAATTQIAALTDEAAVADGAASGAAVSRAATAASRERDILLLGLQEKRLSPDGYLQLLEQVAAQNEQLDSAALRATPEQARQLELIRADDPRLDLFRRDSRLLLESNTDKGVPGDPGAFAALADQRVASISDLAVSVADATSQRAASTERRALLQAAGFLALAVLAILIVLVTLTMLARTITGPLRRLRANAVEMSAVRLPAAMQRIGEQGGEGDVKLPPVLPPELNAGPETTEVARAVDELGAEAIRLATAQVSLRRALDEAFVSMSRRSQSMVEKQLAIIDELESTEQDPDHLRNLFRLDHLAARMRRYNDNLLVIAGSTVRTRTTSPVRIAELFRAATSEMEHYERVRLQPVGGATVLGTVAGELIHLLAELLDNAAMYSPPTTSIIMSAAFTSEGGLHLEIVDAGVGIQANELEGLNARINAGTDDAGVSARMGLFVVARLARRGGFSVRLLSRTDSPGTVAQVSVPPALVLGAPGSSAAQPPLTPAAVAGPTGSRPDPASAGATANGATEDGATSDASRRSPSGLPVRTPGAVNPGGSPLPRQPITEVPAAAAGAIGETGETGTGEGLFTPMPTELTARSAAAAAYQPVNDDLPLIGSYSGPDAAAPTPIFDSISAWFADDPETREIPLREVAAAAEATGEDTTIDLRDAQQAAVTSSRWSALDDQHWVATNTRAAATPEVAGSTQAGLPRRRPGANLLPSASTAATGRSSDERGSAERGSAERDSDGRDSDGRSSAERDSAGRSSAERDDRDADAVRGRLGGYQRGLATARASGSNPFDSGSSSFGGGLFTATREPGTAEPQEPVEESEPARDSEPARPGVSAGGGGGAGGEDQEPQTADGDTSEAEIMDLSGDQGNDSGDDPPTGSPRGGTHRDDQGVDT